MRKPMAKKVLAASLAAAMTMSVAACGNNTPASTASTDNTPASTDSTEVVESTESVEEDEVSEYTVLIDPATGKPYDLGGIEVIVRDWFTKAEREPAKTDFEEAQYAYQDWIQETYNFKIHGETIGDWGSVAQDFVDYVTAGGDDHNYVFTLHSGDPTMLSAVDNGLVYDLSTLDCLDFSEPKFANGVHKLYTIDGGIYAMRAGWAEPRTGVYFNKQILRDAGVDPESLYDMQANDTWTWDAFEDICEKVQQDTDNDGTVDIWAIGVNEGVMTSAAVFSNGGCFVGQDADGKYTYEFESPETLEALEWVRDMFTKYDWNGPEGEDGSAPSWDYYQGQFQNGGCAFCIDQQYCASPGNLFYEQPEELGFVMFPKGPKGKLVQTAQDNICIIPSCYDADTAWKCAFAYSLYNEFVPGFEDYNPYVNSTATGNFDERACQETVPLMAANSTVELQSIIPNLDMGAPFLWKIGPNCDPISEILDGCRDMYKQYIDEANQ